MFLNIHTACHLNKFQNGVYFSCLHNVVLAVIEDRQFGHYFRHLFWKRCKVVPVHAVSHVEDWNQLHSFLNSALYGTERLVSRHGRITFQESATVTQ